MTPYPAPQPEDSSKVAYRDFFDRIADETGEIWWGHRTPAGQARLRRRAQLFATALKDSANARVLEIGCGAGAFTIAVLNELPELHLTGCDLSPKALQCAATRCAGHPHVRFDVADVTRLPYDSASFDAAFTNAVLHYLPLAPALAECARVLKPGGLLWASEPNMMNPQVFLERHVRFIGRRLDNAGHETAFYRWSLAKTLRRAGFENVTLRPYDFMHPGLPERWLSTIDKLGRTIERIPVLREIAGSLTIVAVKPKSS